jgi:gas vesicle protein
VHEIIGLEKASNDAVSLGLESQIDRMKNEIDEYRDKSYEQ